MIHMRRPYMLSPLSSFVLSAFTGICCVPVEALESQKRIKFLAFKVLTVRIPKFKSQDNYMIAAMDMSEA